MAHVTLMEHFGGQSPKVLASTKGARVIFYGTSRRLLTTVLRKVSTRTWNLPSSLSFVVKYTSFDRPAKQLSSWCVRLTVGGSIDALNPSLRRFRRTVTDDGADGLVDDAIQTSRYVNNDAFGQALRAHGSPPLL